MQTETHKQSLLDKLNAGKPLYTSLPEDKSKRIIGTETEFGISNVKESQIPGFISNGGRIYIDNGHHLEYCTPESLGPLEATLYELAGEELCKSYADEITKNIIDLHGNCWGAHENYSCSINPEESHKFMPLVLFLITRQIFTGAGRYFWDKGKNQRTFSLSQRSSFITHLEHVDTQKGRRGIICTRDERHTNVDRLYRFHLIVGDANRSPMAIFLKLGTTALMLELLEKKALPKIAYTYDIERALYDLNNINKKTEKWTVYGTNPLNMDAIDVLREHWKSAQILKGRDQITDDTLDIWENTLDNLEQNPRLLRRRLDWVKKREIAECFLNSIPQQIDQENNTILETLDLQYHIVKAEEDYFGFNFFNQEGEIEKLFSPELIRKAMTAPPPNTRASIRAKIIDEFYNENISNSALFDKSYSWGWDTIKTPFKFLNPRNNKNSNIIYLGDPRDPYLDVWEAIQNKEKKMPNSKWYKLYQRLQI